MPRFKLDRAVLVPAGYAERSCVQSRDLNFFPISHTLPSGAFKYP